MTTDLIRYDLLVQEALKGVVRRVLQNAQRDGLPGDHHFYVSFRTDYSGVRLSQRLRERYPEDMTIVLQHQYENLTVGDSAFEVGLSFSGIAERLRVPFEALTGFFDPSVQFGLKFEVAEEAEPAGETESATVLPAPRAAVPKLGPRAVADAEPSGGDAKPVPAKAAGDKKPAARKSEKAEAPADEGATGEVVSLDAFRKKS